MSVQPTDRAAQAASPQDPDSARRAELGATIRRLRKERGLTLVQLARQAELSHPFLSQLERGLTRPSMPSLHRIARALGTSQQGLLSVAAHTGQDGGDSTAAVRVQRDDDGLTVAHDGGVARMLGASHLGVHAVEYRGVPSSFPDYHFDHSGDEVLYVVAGQVEVELRTSEGTQRHHLRPGDVLCYPGGTPHRWRAVGEGDKVRVLALQNAAAAAQQAPAPETED